jgi:hypothetical protein
MKVCIIIEGNFRKAMKVELTSIDIYVGDDHLRIVCLTGMVDMIIADVMKTVRIPGETIVCHESINLDQHFVDYAKYPMCRNGRQLRYQLQTKFKLHWEYECIFNGHTYVKTTDKDLAQQFAEFHHCSIYKHLTK